MKEKRLLAAVAALLLCLAIPFSAMGDVTPRNTEENGKIRETAWEDENGQPAPGPEGYCFRETEAEGHRLCVCTRTDMEVRFARYSLAQGAGPEVHLTV